jgi:hypothetical protein
VLDLLPLSPVCYDFFKRNIFSSGRGLIMLLNWSAYRRAHAVLKWFVFDVGFARASAAARRLGNVAGVVLRIAHVGAGTLVVCLAQDMVLGPFEQWSFGTLDNTHI